MGRVSKDEDFRKVAHYHRPCSATPSLGGPSGPC